MTIFRSVETPLNGNYAPKDRALPFKRIVAFCATVAMLLIASGPLCARVLSSASHVERSMRQPRPEVSLPWKPVDGDPVAWSPRFVTPVSDVLRTYRSGIQVVKLTVASHGANQSGVTIAGDEPYSLMNERHRTIVFEGQSLSVSETLLRSAQSSLLVWNWYKVDGRFTGNHYLAKLLLAKATLTRSPEGATAIAVATEEQPGVDAAGVRRQFVAHVSLLQTRTTQANGHEN
jgi:EpsI family protein